MKLVPEILGWLLLKNSCTDLLHLCIVDYTQLEHANSSCNKDLVTAFGNFRVAVLANTS